MDPMESDPVTAAATQSISINSADTAAPNISLGQGIFVLLPWD